MLKNIKVVAAAAALSLAAVSAHAATISGNVQITGGIDLDASTFASNGNVTFAGTSSAQNGSGTLSVVNPNSVALVSDIDFSQVGQTIWTIVTGGFTFSATAFADFDDNEGQFTATGVLSAAGFEDTVALLAFDTVALGGAESYTAQIVSTDAAVAPVPLPAAGFLLVGALGGLAAAGRRKAKKA